MLEGVASRPPLRQSSSPSMPTGDEETLVSDTEAAEMEEHLRCGRCSPVRPRFGERASGRADLRSSLAPRLPRLGAPPGAHGLTTRLERRA